MLILVLLGLYFDAVVIFVTSQTLLFRLALAIYIVMFTIYTYMVQTFGIYQGYFRLDLQYDTYDTILQTCLDLSETTKMMKYTKNE